MTVKQRPIPSIVKKAPILLKHPEKATKTDIKSMAARILDDQEYAPKPHKPAKVVMARPSKKK
jgi:hypothetical protein